MNTANLQMEGVLLALAALCGALKSNGTLSGQAIAQALSEAERAATARRAELSDANAEAIRFPIRFLRHALQEEGRALNFAAITSAIGREREAAPSPE
jgi:hypothetical protein